MPFFLLISSLLLDRYFVNTSSLSRGGAVAIIVSLTSALLFMFFYWTMTEFGPFHRHRLHPGWASPRIVLVAELNPLFGWFTPATLFLRGHVLVAFVRWILNFTAFAMLAMGEGLLKPAYEEACCYGKDFITGTEPGAYCNHPDAHASRGYAKCDENGHSDMHKAMKGWAYLFIVVSLCIQVANICLIDYDIVERISKMLEDIKDNKLLTNIECYDKQGQPAGLCTVNLALIFERMGMPKRLMLLAFPGKQEELLQEELEPRSIRVHKHPHWAHPGIFRLLCLDPIFGMILSVQDFVGFNDTRGIVRILCNIWGFTAIFISVELLQPMHRAWCCYGTGRRVQDEHINGTHYTCQQWIEHFSRTGDHREGLAFTDDESLFPNGTCLQHDSVGLVAAWSFGIGVLLIVASILLWVFGFMAAEDSCRHAARRLFRDVKPSQRFLLVQAMDYIGIKHGRVKIIKNS